MEEYEKKDTGYFSGYGNGYIPKKGEVFSWHDGVADENIIVETMTPVPGGHSLEELYRSAVENNPQCSVTIENGAVIIRHTRERQR